MSKNDSFKSLNSSNYTVDKNPIQISIDGQITPIAPGLGPSDTVDPSTTNTPIQDVIDIINSTSVGSGTILLPPETVESPGNLVQTDNIVLRGHGPASVIKITDPTADGIYLGPTDSLSAYENGGRNAYLDGFILDGGNVGNRTSGSAIRFMGQGTSNYGIGSMFIRNWGGSDPVIAELPYSTRWGFIRVRNYTGSFIKATQESIAFDMQIEQIYPGPIDPSAPVIDIHGAHAGVQIGSINCGDDVGRVVRQHDDNRNAWLSIGWINCEPTSNVHIDGGIVELGGNRYTEIGHVSTSGNVTADSLVELTNSDLNGASPGNTRLYNLDPGGGTITDLIEVTGDFGNPRANPMFFHGSPNAINYHGRVKAIQTPSPFPPSNLSGQQGAWEGKMRLDNGSNTPHDGTMCVWNSANSVWVPQHDPTQTFS